jgi:phasin family protein
LLHRSEAMPRRGKSAMATQTPFSDFDVTKLFNPTKMFQDIKFTGFNGFNGFDLEAVMAGQRRNIEAFTAASQAALEGFQSLAKRQAEMVRQTVDESNKAMKEMFAAGSPEEKAARQAELTKAAFERAVANTRELTQLVARSQNDAIDVINKRVAEGLDEVKGFIAKTNVKARAA